MKICFICNTEKSLDEFYKHKGMADGHLNKCKECTKLETKKRFKKLKENPEWVESEKIRGRERYHRLYSTVNSHLDENYNRIWMTDEERTLKRDESRKKWKEANHEKEKVRTKNYRLKYPEKYKAHSVVQYLPCKTGNHLHHWSYNPEHAKDVIEISVSHHNLLHRYIIYDQERMMYRNLKGELLDTRESHIELLNTLLPF